MAVFGIPRGAGGRRAAGGQGGGRDPRAAAGDRDRGRRALRFRTGVNTGPVLTGEGENLAIGDAVNVAARLEQAAAPGEIVLGAETLAWCATRSRSRRWSRWR